MPAQILSPQTDDLIAIFPFPENLTITVWNSTSSSLNLTACVVESGRLPDCEGPVTIPPNGEHDFTVTVNNNGLIEVYTHDDSSVEHDREINIEVFGLSIAPVRFEMRQIDDKTRELVVLGQAPESLPSEYVVLVLKEVNADGMQTILGTQSLIARPGQWFKGLLSWSPDEQKKYILRVIIYDMQDRALSRRTVVIPDPKV